MATIVKTDSGTWKALVRKVGWPTSSKTFRIKRDAEDWGRRIEDEMVRGLYIKRTASEKMSINDALLRYQKEVVPTKSDATQKREKCRISLLKTKLGSYSLAAVTPDIVARYRDERLEAGMANNTVRLEIALLGHLFSTAIKEWQISLPFNPVAQIKKPSPGKGRESRLSLKDQERLLKALKEHSNPMLAWIFVTAIETGMRRNEILTLQIHQVDISRRILSLSNSENGDARTVPLSKAATKTLVEAINNPIRPKDSNLVFFGELGRNKKRSSYQFDKTWREIRDSIGLKHLHFHDLRHEAVSRLVEAGFSDQEAASISGHKSMQMLRRYTHLRAEDLVKKLDKIENLKQPNKK